MARGLPFGLQKEFPWYCRQTLSVKFCTSVVQIGKVNFFMLYVIQAEGLRPWSIPETMQAMPTTQPRPQLYRTLHAFLSYI